MLERIKRSKDFLNKNSEIEDKRQRTRECVRAEQRWNRAVSSDSSAQVVIIFCDCWNNRVFITRDTGCRQFRVCNILNFRETNSSPVCNVTSGFSSTGATEFTEIKQRESRPRVGHPSSVVLIRWWASGGIRRVCAVSPRGCIENISRWSIFMR